MVSFYLESRPNKKTGENPIRVKVSKYGASFVTTIGFSISKEKWNEKKQRVKNGASSKSGADYILINEKLNEIENHFNKFTFSGKGFNSNMLKQEYQEYFCNSKKITSTFSDVFDAFLNEKNQTSSVSRYNNLKSLRASIESQYKKPAIPFFNKMGLEDFTNRLITSGLNNTTIKEKITEMKCFLNWCEEKGILKGSDYNSYKFTFPRVKNKKVVYLTNDELKRVFLFNCPQDGTKLTLKNFDGAEYETTIENRENIMLTKDVFVFCCFTGLRFSDVRKLKTFDIRDNEIHVTTKKTSTEIIIELNDVSEKIYNKYKDLDKIDSFLFPHEKMHVVHTTIKRLCELCEINELITLSHFEGNRRVDETKPKYEFIATHCGRKTFIVNALSMGITPDVVMSWTGHANYNSMKPYIAITEKAKKAAMTKFNKAFD